MDYFTTTSSVSRRAADCLIVGVYDQGKLSKGAADVDEASHGAIQSHLKSGDVSAKPGTCSILRDVPGVASRRVAVVGLGKAGDFGAAEFRRAVGTALQAVSNTKSRQVLNSLTLEKVRDCDLYYLARHTAQAIGDALYRFSSMKTGRQPPAMPLKKVGLAVATRGDADKARLGARHGDAIVEGMNLARDLGNLPANVCTPSYLARTAQKLARKHREVQTRVLN
jgi:leucyl aminopeptidase